MRSRMVVAPLASAKSAHWMRNNLFGTVIPDSIVARMEAASDPKAEGRAICIDLIQELATIEGVGGVHIMAPMNDAAIPVEQRIERLYLVSKGRRIAIGNFLGAEEKASFSSALTAALQAARRGVTYNPL